MIADCGLNEFGGTTGGRMGDQTGGEYALKQYYHMDWNGVLRYTGNEKIRVRACIAAVCTLAAKNDHIGYDATWVSGGGRESYFNQLKKVGYDPSKVKVNCAASCSSSTCGNVVAVGHILDIPEFKKLNPFLGTLEMRSAFTKIGFSWLTGSKYTSGTDNLVPGDILLDEDTHATVWVGNGSYTNIKSKGSVGSTGSSSSSDGGSIDLQTAVSKLYASDNFRWVQNGDEDDKEKTRKVLIDSYRKTVQEARDKADKSFGSIVQRIITQKVELKKIESYKQVEKRLVKGQLASYPTLVQAPYIEVELNGVTIGGYDNDADRFPNHITSLSIDKINGRINNYTISLIHQVRVGEDPNLIDKLLSRTGYRNKIKIKYGDSAYASFFREDEAYIMDVTHSDNVSGMSISYTIKATSSVANIQEAYFDFVGKTSKPSAEIIDMLYNNKETSTALLGLLGGMRNKVETLGKGFIPEDDDRVYIPGLKDASLLDRLMQLVSYMKDSSSPSSSYFLSFGDSANGQATFKITKVQKQPSSDSAIKNCYYLDVGYPGDSFVTSFSINTDVYFPMFYKYADGIENYNYDIDYTGNLIKTKVNPLLIDNKYMDVSTRNENWWDFVTSYPISATIQIKGLMRPVLLMENVFVYAQFYGQEDMATGMYSIVGQHDTISGSGYTTTLELLRIS